MVTRRGAGLLVLVLWVGACTDAEIAWKRRHADFMWKPEQITVTVRRDTHYGHIVDLFNHLKGECGWVRFHARLPNAWRVEGAALVDGSVHVRLKDGRTLAVRPPGLLALDAFDLTDASDADLEALWARHATSVNGPSGR
ncbi:MAG: hypothetical protein MUE73_04620 [Planctomycetes bacterium]|jgi:hypothetical protein|nr:hypothetical protein [Planctomycetota bacterium]